jgi:hypothetical protein
MIDSMIRTLHDPIQRKAKQEYAEKAVPVNYTNAPFSMTNNQVL